MDSEKLKQFIIPIALIILLLAGVCYVAPKIIENYQSQKQFHYSTLIQCCKA